MIDQREADLAVLMSVYTRSKSGNRPSQRLNRVQNSLTAGGYFTVPQFTSAIDTLLRFQMIGLEANGGEQDVEITAHGDAWLMANFHWVEDERLILEPNNDAWVMTPLEPGSSSSSGAEDR